MWNDPELSNLEVCFHLIIADLQKLDFVDMA